MSRSGSDAGASESLWTRPDGDVEHLHEYCPNLVVDWLEAMFSEDDSKEEDQADGGDCGVGGDIDGPVVATDADSSEGGDVDFRFLAGKSRWVVEHTPFFVPVTGIVFLIANFVTGSADIGVLLSLVRPAHQLGAALLLALAGVLLWLVAATGLAGFWDIVRGFGVYGWLVLLIGGTAYSTVLGPQTEIFGSLAFTGYLLMLYAGGLLVYDGMLRTEYLFGNLATTDVVETGAYERRYREMSDAFDTSQRKAVIFAILWSALFLALPLFTQPKSALKAWARPASEGVLPVSSSFLSIAIACVLNVFIVLVAFRFMMLVKHFHRMLMGTSSAGGAFQYQPFHPDDRGGFGDLGRFATRVNVILVVGGLYVIYHFTVRVGTQSASGFPFVVVGIVVAYAVAALGWLYYSFWMLHREMARGKRRCLSGERDPKRYGGQTVYSSPEWTDLREAPVWPISYTQLLALLTVNVIPLLLSFGLQP